MRAILWVMATTAAAISMFQLSSSAQAPKRQVTVEIVGTAGHDVLTVNDYEGVIVGSPGMVMKGAVKGPQTLEQPDARAPLSEKGHLIWTFQGGNANNYFTGNFGAGDDRYTRIDGPGNDRYEYDAGPGNDVITSTDGPGNDEYIYDNGAGNDLSAHVNSGRESAGNDVYQINGAAGADRVEIVSDGPGDDTYDLRNIESIGFTDYYFNDNDKFNFSRDAKVPVLRGSLVPSPLLALVTMVRHAPSPLPTGRKIRAN